MKNKKKATARNSFLSNKKKWITSLVAGLTLLIAGCATTLTTAPSTGDIPPLIAEWTERNVWKVLVSDRATGSAFWISDRRMVTACHVVSSLPVHSKGIASNSTRQLVATYDVESCNSKTDIAILLVTSVDGKFETDSTPISYILPLKNSRVYGSGYPLWFPLTTNSGYFGEEVFLDGWGIRYTNSIPTMLGDSGSPLLSIRNGKVFIEGVRVGLASIPGRFSSQVIAHMAISTSGKDILKELILVNNKEQSK